MLNLSAWRLGFECLNAKPLTLAGVFALALAQLASVLLITQVFQDTLTAPPNADSIAGRALTMVVLGIASSAGIFGARFLSARIASAATRDLRLRLLDLFYTRAYGYYVQTSAGTLHATIVWDTERVEKLSQAVLGQMLPAFVVGAGASAAMLWLNPTLTLILMLTLPLLLVFNRYSLRALRQQSAGRIQALSAYSRATLAFIQHMGLTLLQTAEEQETARQTTRIDSLKREALALSQQLALHVAIQNALLLIIVGTLLVVGGSQVAAGQTTLGRLLAFNAILVALGRYSQDVLGSAPILADGMHALGSLHQLIARTPPDPYTGTHHHKLRGTITLRDVTFGYTDDAPVFRRVNLTLAPHTLTALYGANASGKTTLVNLILGLYRPQEGCLQADDHPYADLDMRGLRRQVGVLPQDPVLFDGTVWENITYGMPWATRDDVTAAAEMAAADKIIQELPQEYDTLVGERGMRLSGGQRQRIALARVLLRQPQLLILDEPTNHLDAMATRQLVEHVMRRENPPTTLVITHDMTLASQMDRLYLLHEGSLTATRAPLPLEGLGSDA